MDHKIPILRRPSGNYEAVRDRFSPQAHTDRVLKRLARMEIPGKEHLENYMRHRLRVNHEARTIDSTSIMFFLDLYGKVRQGRS